MENLEAKIADLEAEIADLEAENKVLTAENDALKTLVEDLQEQLEDAKAETQSIVVEDTEKVKTLKVPTDIFKVNKIAYRFKYASMTIDGEVIITADILKDPEKLAKIVKEYPGSVESVES